MNKLHVKRASGLTNREIEEINQASKREFHESFTGEGKSEAQKRLFFLLKDKNGKVIAMGQLIPVEPVRFMGETLLTLLLSKGLFSMIMVER